MDESQTKLGNSLLCLGMFFLWYMISFAIALFPWAKMLTETGYDLVIFHLSEALLMGYLLMRYRRHGLDVNLGSPSRSMFIHFVLATLGLICVSQFFATQEPWVADYLKFSSTADMTLILTLLVIAPIGEEIVFRGFFLQAFLLWGGKVASAGIVISAAFFTMIHWQYSDPVTFVSLFMIAVLLAYARIKSGGLMLPVILHMLLNSISLGTMLFL
ncbi:CPBP family intramembrane glutamic endopeptidase [Rahnella sp. AA]|uniref:CPBP family intramembrane glutamic endopeptidase n=1 Tax=Rahnella sp. AA TaxID=2057180 RepID=UPI0012FE7F56|nr:CPBP family intramembrane glutamic endopeptidase [Rahnella sp. AA]